LQIATEDELDRQKNTYYATYFLDLLKPFPERDHQPTEPRVSNMQDMLAFLLGVPCEERRPNVVIADKTRTIAGRHVCIATQATAQCKYWNNPRGWPTLIERLKTLGYRVLCIEHDKQYGNAQYMTTMPEGAEDFTGSRPLQERASLLLHADFFFRIGQWTVAACMGRGHARGHDQRFLAPADGVPHAVSRNQFPRLQYLQ
jgi:autotransporter strand-loop-strand O-heptosyltransferase